MRLVVVVALPYTTQPSYAKISESYNIRGTKVVDVGRYPAAIVELVKVRAGFVITANEECEVGCNAGAAIVFVEIADSPVFVGYGHAVEIIAVADCLSLLDRYGSQSGGKADLEVAPNDEQANCSQVVDLTSLLDGGVDRVESAMTLFPHQLGTLVVG